MCELLGISCSAKVRPGRYFKAFRRRGKEFQKEKEIQMVGELHSIRMGKPLYS